MGSRSSMQGVAWHYVNYWELKSKDEFAWETGEKKKRKRKKKKNKNINKEVKKSTPMKTRMCIGSFILKFENEEPEEYIIGKNISPDAKILKQIYNTREGSNIMINGEKATLIKKDLR